MGLLDGGVPPSVISKFGLVSLPVTSYRVVRGESFSLGKRVDVPANGTSYLSFDPTNVPVGKSIVILPLSISAIGGLLDVDFNIDPLFNLDGTVINGLCRNIEQNNVSDIKIRLEPTVTDEGTNLLEFLLPASGLGVNVTNATMDTLLPMLLDKSKKYLFKFDNKSGTVVNASINFSWFEF